MSLNIDCINVQVNEWTNEKNKAWSKEPTLAFSLYCFPLNYWMVGTLIIQFCLLRIHIEAWLWSSTVLSPRNRVLSKTHRVWAFTELILQWRRQMSTCHRVIHAMEGEDNMNIYLFLDHLVSKINIMLICIFFCNSECLALWVRSYSLWQ